MEDFEKWLIEFYPTGLNYQDRNSLIFVMRPQSFMVFVPVATFLEMFGEVGAKALEEGKSEAAIVQALKDSDPDNRFGYNTLL